MNVGFSVVYEIDQQGTVLVRDIDGNRRLPYGPIVAARIVWAPSVLYPQPHGRLTAWLDERDGVDAPLVCDRAGSFGLRQTTFNRPYYWDPLDPTRLPRLKTWWSRAGEEPPHRSMVLQNSDAPNYTASGTTHTNTFSFTPTSGRLLVLFAICDNGATSLTSAPTGYTLIYDTTYHGFASSSYKTAAGSETSAAWTLGSSDDSQSLAAEWSGYDAGGLDKSAVGNCGTNVSTCTSATSASTTKATSLVLAGGTNSSHDGTFTWTSSSPLPVDLILLNGGAGGECQGKLGSVDVTTTQTLTVVGNNSTADQTHVWIANWGETVAGGATWPGWYSSSRGWS